MNPNKGFKWVREAKDFAKTQHLQSQGFNVFWLFEEDYKGKDGVQQAANDISVAVLLTRFEGNRLSRYGANRVFV